MHNHVICILIENNVLTISSDINYYNAYSCSTKCCFGGYSTRLCRVFRGHIVQQCVCYQF